MKIPFPSVVKVPAAERKTALITGASGGMGEVYARKLAASGYDLILVNRSENKLKALSDELESSHSISARIIMADLSKEKDVDTLLGFIAGIKNISLLVNNAGYGSGVEFHQAGLAQHMLMLNLHVVASLRLVHAVLPDMIARGEGAIINVSSMGAFTPASGSTIYCGTKLFLKGFSESLYMEVNRYGIKIQCLCPGFTRTGFHKNRLAGELRGNGRMINWMEPERVVDISLKALRGSRVVVIPGLINRLTLRLIQLFPRWLYYEIMRLMTKEKKACDTVESQVAWVA